MKKIPIHNAINDVNLWYGIADSHDTFPYMLCELCDDSISSMVANQTEQREIAITLQECAAENGQGDIYVRVEDTGAGIKNLDACMTYASSAGAGSGSGAGSVLLVLTMTAGSAIMPSALLRSNEPLSAMNSSIWYFAVLSIWPEACVPSVFSIVKLPSVKSAAL